MIPSDPGPLGSDGYLRCLYVYLFVPSSTKLICFYDIVKKSLCVYHHPTAGRSAREEGCCPVVTFALVGAKDRSSRNLSAPIGRIAAGLAEATPLPTKRFVYRTNSSAAGEISRVTPPQVSSILDTRQT